MTPLDHAKRRGHTKVIAMLKNLSKSLKAQGYGSSTSSTEIRKEEMQGQDGKPNSIAKRQKTQVVDRTTEL